MICKKVPNKGGGSKAARVGGLADYIISPELSNGQEKCIAHGAENFLTDTHAGHVAEMISLAQETVHSKNPVDHWVMSWRSDEHPTPEQAKQAVEIFIKQAGLEGHQYIWGLHDDTENKHIHIEVNRVHPDTLKVVSINKGFDREASQQAIALIEHTQGWQSEKGSRYVIENGKPVMTQKAKSIKTDRKLGTEPIKVATHAADMEVQTGTKSEQRIGIEQAAPIIQQAKSWKELHASLAAVGIEYRREGSGAKIYVDENAVGVKASDVHRSASFGSLQKRLGAYQPATEINKNEYHHHSTTNSRANELDTKKPHAPAYGKKAGDSLRNLSECRLAVIQESGKASHKSVLHIDGRASGRPAGGLRRDTGRDNTRAAEPLKHGQAGWKEYQSIKEEMRTLKATATTDLSKQQAAERTALFAQQKAERAEALKGNWKGKGDARNVAQSFIATHQAAAKLELSEHHKYQRKELQQQFKPLPQYKAWKDQPQIVAAQVKPLIDQHIERDKQPQRLSEIVKSLTYTIDHRKHITYQSGGKDIFRDEGKILAVLDQSSNSLAATLAVAQQKYGSTLTLTGSDVFKQKAVAAAVANNMTVKFSDPALETMRVQMVEQQRQAEREAMAQARAAEQQRIEATAKLEKEKEAAAEKEKQADQVKVINTELTPRTDEPKKAIEGVELSSFEYPMESKRNELEELRKAAELYCADTKHAGKPIFDSDCKPASRNIGTIAAVSENYFAVAGHDKVTIHPLTEAVKQCIETDGSTTPAEALVPGNKADVSYWANGRDVVVEITEQRKELQKAPERDYGNGF